jgi:hypothetical protein
MRKYLVTCDRCGKDCGEKGYKVVFGCENENTAGRIDSPETDKLDFCENCLKQIQQMVAGFAERREVEPTPVQKEKKQPKIDKGKVRALRNAGWKVKDIAGEMGCSNQAIYNVLKEFGDDSDAAEPVLAS